MGGYQTGKPLARGLDGIVGHDRRAGVPSRVRSMNMNDQRFSVEQLEERRMMSAGVFGERASLWEAPAAVVMTRSPMAVKKPQVAIPGVVGQWTGTATSASNRAQVAISMRITRQSGAGATGVFSLGPITGNSSVVSTAIVSGGNQRHFRVILEGKGFYGSVTATISKNGAQIVGRWACNGPVGGWKTGTLVLNMAG